MSLSQCESCVSLPSDIMRYSYPATILKNGKKTGLRQPVTIESFLADRQKASVKQGCQLILFEMALVMAEWPIAALDRRILHCPVTL